MDGHTLVIAMHNYVCKYVLCTIFLKYACTMQQETSTAQSCTAANDDSRIDDRKAANDTLYGQLLNEINMLYIVGT